jgi:hypothetical protein
MHLSDWILDRGEDQLRAAGVKELYTFVFKKERPSFLGLRVVNASPLSLLDGERG